MIIHVHVHVHVHVYTVHGLEGGRKAESDKVQVSTQQEEMCTCTCVYSYIVYIVCLTFNTHVQNVQGNASNTRAIVTATSVLTAGMREGGKCYSCMYILCMDSRPVDLRSKADHSTGNLVGKTDEVIRFNISQILVATVVFFLWFPLRLQVRVGSGWFLMGGRGREGGREWEGGGGREGWRNTEREREMEEEERK